MFPGISGPFRPLSGGLGLDSGMALSSGASGAIGFTAFGTVGNKQKLILGKVHALNYNSLAILLDMSFI